MCARIALVEARIKLKRTTLWKSGEPTLARCWGLSQPAISRANGYRVSKIHPRGRKPSPDCESWVLVEATRALPRIGPKQRLLAIRGALPKPRSPLTNHIINLLLKYTKEREEGWLRCLPNLQRRV